jgi:predicted AAA+ superfamily ATPase
MIFLGLKRRGLDVAYVRNEDGPGVDFLVRDAEGSESLVQACAEFPAAATRERKLRPLRRAMAARGLRRGTVVTRVEREELRVAEGKIQVVPAWEGLLW